MSDPADTLQYNLSLFGLSNDEIVIYLSVVKDKNSSALQISRRTKIPRTRIYRILEKLIAKGLVVENIDDIGSKFTTNSIKEVEGLLIRKEREIEKLKEIFPTLISQLSFIEAQDKSNTQVKFYRGIEGLEQITWNSTKAKGLFRIYEIGNMNAFTDQKFAAKVRDEFEKKKIPHRQLTTIKHVSPFLECESPKYWMKDEFWELRYIDPEEISFNFEILMYDDVYAMYTFHGEEIFCIEIHNQALADMQKQIYDFIWKHAKKMKRIGKYGEQILEE